MMPTITNGGTLFLKKYNSGGHDYVTETIPNLTIRDSIIRHNPFSSILKLTLTEMVAIEGDSTIYFQGGTYGSHLWFNGGISGSGTLRAYRTDAGSTGPHPDNGTRLYLTSGDYSGYSGDWTIENSVNDEVLEFLVGTASGWGSGDLTLGRGGNLQVNTTFVAAESDVVVNADAYGVTLADGTAAVIRSLTVDGNPVDAGTYTAEQLNTLTGTSLFSDAGTLKVTFPTAGTVILVM